MKFSSFTLIAIVGGITDAFAPRIRSWTLNPAPQQQALLWGRYNDNTDDNEGSRTSVIRYRNLVDVLSNADYMSNETKARFLESLLLSLKDDDDDEDELVRINDEVYDDNSGSNTSVRIIQCSNITASKVPTVQGRWENNNNDDGYETNIFRTSGAWQKTPLLMKGVFLDDIRYDDFLMSNDTVNNNNDNNNNNSNNDHKIFPTWEETIGLACRRHNNDDDWFSKKEDDKIMDGKDHNNDDDDDDDDDDGNVYFWTNEDDDDYHHDDEDDFMFTQNDDEEHAPSRLIQYASSSNNTDSINHDWLDTFEINRFGPFDDNESLEKLLLAKEGTTSPSFTSSNNNVNNTTMMTTTAIATTCRTLLVNDVDRWFPKLSAWMDRRFNYNNNNNNNGGAGVLPARWRRDDAQISLSYKNGGIGPHVDNYDVFLVQLRGERFWDILWDDNDSNNNNNNTIITSMDNNDGRDEVDISSSSLSSFVSLQDEMDCILPESSANGVRILNVTKLLQSKQEKERRQHCFSGKRTTATKKLTRLLLRPGDCLYLPPRILHCGTAATTGNDDDDDNRCMTLSIGCRAPSALELLDELMDFIKNAPITTEMKKKEGTIISPLSDAVLQSFHKRYTNENEEKLCSSSTNNNEKDSKPNRNDHNNIETHNNDNNDYKLSDNIHALNMPSSSLSASSWLSPDVKNDMKNLILNAVRTTLDDDENVLDPLLGMFLTKSNRVEDDNTLFIDNNDRSNGDISFLSSFSYPKPLRRILMEDVERKKRNTVVATAAANMPENNYDKEIEIWANASNTINEVFGRQSSLAAVTPIGNKANDDIRPTASLKRAEGVAFTWSCVYDSERGVRKYRLYTQGRPPFEVFEEVPPQKIVSDKGEDEVTTVDKEVPSSSYKDRLMILSSSLPPDLSVNGRLLDRIANGPPIDRAFFEDILELHIDVDKEKYAVKKSVTKLLYDLVEEGLLYGEYSSHLGRMRRGQWI